MAEDGFTIIEDRREQRPLDFSPFAQYGVKVEHAALRTGDYTIKGLRRQVVIERKSLQDCVSTLTHGRERFTREIYDRAAFATLKVLVVEASWADLSRPYPFAPGANPESIVNSLFALMLPPTNLHVFCSPSRALIAWYIRELSKYPIKVKMNTEITDVKSLGADEVIVATGAKAKRIPVKGAENAIEAIDFLLGNKTVGDKVVVIGGGLTGCEIAYELYLQGKQPTIVEMQDDLITTKGICLANTSFLRDFFKTNKVPVHLETSLCEVGEGSVTVKDKDGKTFDIEADSVIMSVGYNPAPLTTKGVHVIGDAASVGNLRTVIWGAWDVAMKL